MVNAERKKGDETYYSKLKAENEELKQKVEWLDKETWLLKDKPDIEQVYEYMVKKPESAKFIYNKYQQHQKVIRELCDPKNPLYIDGVKKELEGIVVIEDKVKNFEEQRKALEEEYTQLKEKIAEAKNEKSTLESEIKEVSTQWEEWQDKLDDIEKRREEVDKEVGNLQDPDVLKKIKSFNESFTALVKSIFDNVKSQDINDVMFQSIKLTQDQKNTLKLLSEQSEEIKKLIEDEDMLSEFKLSEKRQALKEQIEKEQENAKKEMDGFMAHNPQKIIKNVKEHINLSLDRITGVKQDVSGYRYYNDHEYGTITGELYEAISNIEILNGQVENKGIWSKLRKGE
jgi:chromosome segregation ATPase